MKLTLGFSPCPNDTFIFDALINKKIDTLGFAFEVVLEDVQTLNNYALQNRLDVSKISYGVLPLLIDHYWVLNSGGALGKGVGPLLIAKQPLLPGQTIGDKIVAIPGENTTAHLLFSMAFPHAVNKRFMFFNKVEEAVLSGEADAGVIIHENRFTYQQKGLIKLMDLGTYWEEKTNVPIPLGGIVAKRSLPLETIKTIDRLIKESVEYAFTHYPTLPDFVTRHAQEMDENVMRQHIELYVNEYSVNLSGKGMLAIQKLMEVYTATYPAAAQQTKKYFVSAV